MPRKGECCSLAFLTPLIGACTELEGRKIAFLKNGPTCTEQWNSEEEFLISSLLA